MRIIKAVDLARQLGISTRSMAYICKNNPSMATKGPARNAPYYVVLDRIPGMELIDALMLPTQRWMKAAEIARRSGKSRKSINNWCRTRSKFGVMFGGKWYVNVSEWEDL